MDKTIQVCIRCSTSLAIGLKLHFCPYCGTAQLEKKLLEQKTTQNFNPDNPNYKPWREKPLLPKRNYKTLPSKKPKPWCPPMRQLRVRPEKTKSSKHCNGNIAIPIVETFGDVIDGSIGGSAACNNDDVVATDAPAYEEDISPPDIQSEPYIGCKIVKYSSFVHSYFTILCLLSSLHPIYQCYCNI